MTIPERFRYWKLSDMDPPPKQAVEYCDKYLPNIKSGRGMIIIGPTGTGKTTLSIAVLNEIADRVYMNGKYLTWERFARWITAHDLHELARDFDSPEHIEHRNIKLLVIDDIGATRLTEYAQSEMASLLDHRYASFLPTIVTSNLSAADFTAYLGERSLSRFKECNELIELSGPDRRGQNKTGVPVDVPNEADTDDLPF